eukprot:Clim_evm5s197 gene=Clim_evmTU5s197
MGSDIVVLHGEEKKPPRLPPLLHEGPDHGDHGKYFGFMHRLPTFNLIRINSANTVIHSLFSYYDTDQPKIQEGTQFQADIPDTIEETRTMYGAPLSDRAMPYFQGDSLVRRANLVDFEVYLSKAQSRNHCMSLEQCLALLHANDYVVQGSMLDLNFYSPIVTEWTEAEMRQFDESMSRFGKDFKRYRRLLPNKNMRHLVCFYYKWKKTRRRDMHIDQLLNVPKKKVTLEGAATTTRRKATKKPRSTSGSNKGRGGPRGPCLNCGVRTSPMWRKGPDNHDCCNACALYWKKYGYFKPGTQRPPQPLEDIPEQAVLTITPQHSAGVGETTGSTAPVTGADKKDLAKEKEREQKEKEKERKRLEEEERKRKEEEEVTVDSLVSTLITAAQESIDAKLLSKMLKSDLESAQPSKSSPRNNLLPRLDNVKQEVIHLCNEMEGLEGPTGAGERSKAARWQDVKAKLRIICQTVLADLFDSVVVDGNDEESDAMDLGVRVTRNGTRLMESSAVTEDNPLDLEKKPADNDRMATDATAPEVPAVKVEVTSPTLPQTAPEAIGMTTAMSENPVDAVAAVAASAVAQDAKPPIPPVIIKDPMDAQ